MFSRQVCCVLMLFGRGFERGTRVAQANARLCMCVAHATSFAPMQQMPHTCTALHGHLVQRVCSREKKWFPCYTGFCHHEYFGDTCCWHQEAARTQGFCLVFPPVFHPQTIEAEHCHRKKSKITQKVLQMIAALHVPPSSCCHFFFFFFQGRNGTAADKAVCLQMFHPWCV